MEQLRKFLVFFIVLVSSGSCPAQGQPSKRHLNESDYMRWGSITSHSLSVNGKWLSWSLYYDNKADTLFAESADSKKHYEFPGSNSSLFFGEDAFYCRLPDMTGQITTLTNGKKLAIGKAISASVLGPFLVAANPEQWSIGIWNDKGSKIMHLPASQQYSVSPNGDVLLYITELDGKSRVGLLQVNKRQIELSLPVNFGEYDRFDIESIAWSASGNAVAFCAKSKHDTILFHLNIPKIKVSKLKQSELQGSLWLDPGLDISINGDGNVIFSVRQALAPKQQPELVEVWNMEDKVIYNNRMGTMGWKYTPKASLWNPDDGTVQVVADREFPKATFSADGKYALLWNPQQYEPQYLWTPKIALYAIDLSTSKKKLVVEHLGNYAGAWQTSPCGKYITYFHDGNWYNYELDKNRHLILSNRLKASGKGDDAYADTVPFSEPIWASDGKSLLLFDEFDLWHVAADGSWAKRLTKGKENNIVFRIPAQPAVKPLVPSADGLISRQIDMDKEILLEATATDYTKSGFYLLKSNNSLEVAVYDASRNYSMLYSGKTLSWVSERYDSPPKLRCKLQKGQITDIMDNQKSLVDLHWGKVQRITYSFGSDSLAGLLYYPAGYTVGCKYPMLVHIYQKQSSSLHHFIKPSIHSDGFNITNFTSQGYFVLLPDIIYRIGSPGDSALQCTEAAVATAIRNQPDIDQNALGLIGYSFGGYEASYIATKSNKFKAVVTGAGITDFASDYFSVAAHYEMPQYYRYETFQMRMGKPFHKNIQGYIDNSPVYQASGVSAPVLIYTGGQDMHINNNQSREFYFALRRLGKTGYLLVYPEQDHGFFGSDAMKDITTKIQSFFNHYLKGEIPKQWMLPQ
jgi:dipeptidyl aminopeptidase/acylaminoacyl peptidase